jgi:dipeptidyl aminopeptidase/acylaminoacyl peptidase
MPYLRRMKKLLYLILFLPAIPALAQPKTRIVATDLTRIKTVGNVTISPDGQQAVYTLTTIEPGTDQSADSRSTDNRAVEYDYRTHLYLTDRNPNTTRALTHGTESARQPAWSPDGKSLAFVRNVKGKPQIFVMPLGNGGGEGYQLTTGKYGASGPQWSPDGSRILFESTVTMSELLADSLLNPGKRPPVWSAEKPGFANNNFLKPDKWTKANPDGSLAEIRAYLAKDVEDKKAKVINRLNFQGESGTEPEMTFTHLFTIVPREGATARPLSRGFYSFGSPVWLPNGAGILAVTDRDTLNHPDREQDAAIVFLPANGSGNRTVVLGKAGNSYGSPAPSPDGRRLAFLSSPSAGVNYGQLSLAKLAGFTASEVQAVTFNRAAGSLQWATQTLQTGKRKRDTTSVQALFFTAQSNGGIPLYRLNPESQEISFLTDFNTGITSFDVRGFETVFARTQVSNPSELYIATFEPRPVYEGKLKTGETWTNIGETKLTNHNDWVAGKLLSTPEKRTFQNALGQAVEYWIMKPSRIDPVKKHPLLLNMHGGPTAMWGPGEPSMWHELQFMCSQGYGVVYANPRGSGGYGLAFQQANTNDWGTGPADDVLKAATDAAREAWVDTSRQVITGGSYAGYLTAWIVGHDNRFKAAFSQRGVYDLTTFMGEGNAWRLVPNYFAYPWTAEGKRVLDANSPYTFVENIRTPLLIKHGENDLRTGVIQSEMLYKSLKILGRPVEYVRMPGATHELSRSGNVRQRIDRILRIYEFFERYVGESSSTAK